MTALDVFQYGEHQVRTVMVGDEPWFVTTDVAAVLGYRDAYNLTRRLDDDEKGTHSASTPGGTQMVGIISEAGLYTAILGSQVPNAKAFKRWVTHDVLPTLRRTGRYGSDVDMLASLPSSQLLSLAAEAAKRAEVAEAKIAADAPKVHFADAVAASPSTVLVGDLAKILRAQGVQIGANRLFQQLRDEGYLIRREGSDWNMPTQKSMELGLFQIKESTRQSPDGVVHVTKTPKVTGKGQQYFIDRYAPRDGVLVIGVAS